MPPPRPTDAPCPPEGLVDESGPVGHSLMVAERPKVGYPFMGTQVDADSASQSGATTLRVLLPTFHRKSKIPVPRKTQLNSRRRRPTQMSGPPSASLIWQ